MDIHLIETGVANTASVEAAFRRIGCGVVSTCDPEKVEGAQYLVLPGVGSFGAGMHALEEANLVETIRRRVELGRPTLAICLGMQLMTRGSEESPNVMGLGVIDAWVTAFPTTVNVPQFGWNTIDNGAQSVGAGGYVYFANSFRLATTDLPGWDVSVADYGGPFCGAVERGAVLACQFHPELSGAYGAGILSGWIERGRSC